MAAAPTAAEVAAWLEVANAGTRVAPLAEVTAAAVDYVTDRCTFTAPGVWSASQHTAAVMLAARLYRRRNSPEGVAGFDAAGVVRILARDPDVSGLLGLSLKLDGFT